MESDNGSNSSKPRYDITMSKRRRKPSNLNTILPTVSESPVKDVLDEEDRESDRKSLEHMIKSRNSLGDHFTQEEKQLQLVKMNQGDKKGLKLRGMVTHCTKVLSHLIKLKRDPARIGSRKKPILRLPSEFLEFWRSCFHQLLLYRHDYEYY